MRFIRSHYFAKAAVVAAIILLVGCASSGTQVKDAQLDQFQKGVTTEAQVIKALGQPQLRTRAGDGTHIVIYAFSQVHAKARSFIPIVGAFSGGAAGRTTSVSFIFDPNGKLKDVTSSESNVDVNTGIGASTN